jgi:uncharacterized membrane protein YdjX (TVP38/TMEM64 family)
MHNNGRDFEYVFKAVLLVVLVTTFCILVVSELPAEWLDPRWIESLIENMGVLAPLAYILIRTVAVVLTVVPNAPLDVAGGMLFGPLWGTVYSLIGSETGAIVCFMLAHALGRQAITRLLHRDLSFGIRYPQRHLAFIVLFARLEPVFSFALVSYGAGLTGMSLGAFAISTLVGITPGTVLLNYYGKTFFTGVSLLQQIFMGLALVALLLAIPVWIKRYKPEWWNNGNNEADPPEGGQ